MIIHELAKSKSSISAAGEYAIKVGFKKADNQKYQNYEGLVKVNHMLNLDPPEKLIRKDRRKGSPANA